MRWVFYVRKKINDKLNLDITNLIDLRKRIGFNLLIDYLNINSLSNETELLSEICKYFEIETFCIDETILDCSFPENIFKICGYHYPGFIIYWDDKGGGK